MQSKSIIPPSWTDRSQALLKRIVVLGVTLFIGLLAEDALGSQTVGKVRFSWDQNPESIVTGYRVHWGTQPGVYTNTLDVGNVTEVVIEEFIEGVTHYSAITAYSDSGEESDYSDEVAFVWTAETTGNGIPKFQITSLELTPTGQISIQFAGDNGLTSVDVQASNDLINWSSLGIAIPVDGAIQIADPQAAEQSSRFYRLGRQPE